MEQKTIDYSEGYKNDNQLMEMHSARYAGVFNPAGDMSPEDAIAFFARVSNPNNQMNYETAPRLLKFLVVNSHWSPFDMVQMSVKVRTTRSIAAQILRHWSFRFQEFSQRYAEVSEFDFSKVEARVKAAGGNRQGSAEVDEVQTHYMQELCAAQSQNYMTLTQDNGEDLPPLAPESARDILPLATPTTLYMTGSVRSWMTYFWQRLCPHAQKEHREVAWSMFAIFEEQFPMIADLVLNHRPQVVECDWSSDRPSKDPEWKQEQRSFPVE